MKSAPLAALWYTGAVAIFAACGAAVFGAYFVFHFSDQALSVAFWQRVFRGLTDPRWIADHLSLAWMLYGPGSIGGIVLPAAAGVVFALFNPFVGPADDYGSAQWAAARDYKGFTISVTAKRGIVLGRIGRRFLMSDAPLSALLVAPAGTGKTAGTIIPSILASDDAHLVINDVKGELYERTAGHRARLGRVVRIEWQAGPDKSVCWNPLGLSSMPADDASRGNYADRLASVLVTGKESDFFVSAPRMALSAMLLFHIYESEAEGEEPSFGRLLEWRGSLSRADDDDVEDASSFNLGMAATRAEVEGWPSRITIGLRQLSTLDFRTRSNVLASIDSALKLWLNENVAGVTARSDFTFDEVFSGAGGLASLYIVVPPFDQQAFGKVTSLLIEALTQYLTTAKREKGGPVRFILDEAGFLAPTKAISMGPAVTRSYGVSFLFAVQDFGQIRDNWGQGGLDNILTNTAFKVVLAQNHPETSEWFSRLIGNTTRIRKSRSRDVNGSKLWLQARKSEQAEGVPLIRAQDISSLPFGRQLVIVQSNVNRPIACKSAFWFKSGWLRRRSKATAPAV